MLIWKPVIDVICLDFLAALLFLVPLFLTSHSLLNENDIVSDAFISFNFQLHVMMILQQVQTKYTICHKYKRKPNLQIFFLICGKPSERFLSFLSASHHLSVELTQQCAERSLADLPVRGHRFRATSYYQIISTCQKISPDDNSRVHRKKALIRAVKQTTYSRPALHICWLH